MDEEVKANQLIKILKIERPQFEESFIAMGGSIDNLKWTECDDQTGSYVPDWDKIDYSLLDSVEAEYMEKQVADQAHLVTSCLMSWVHCAFSKQLPQGFYVVPLQPTIEMIESAKKEFDDLNLNSNQKTELDDLVVFSHQAMIQEHLKAKA